MYGAELFFSTIVAGSLERSNCTDIAMYSIVGLIYIRLFFYSWRVPI